MAKGNPLQEQLLKAGLVKKSKLAEVAREQVRARHGKGPVEPGEIQREAERVLAALRGRLAISEDHLVETGAAIGAHAGPGALIVAVQPSPER